uniref:WW domain-containing protein n=1 Tax=Eutreptiella gymnastica TaxID=73025 RepID=A0A7S4CU21_9EUGL
MSRNQALPNGWEAIYIKDHAGTNYYRWLYINHGLKRTQWEDPRLHSQPPPASSTWRATAPRGQHGPSPRAHSNSLQSDVQKLAELGILRPDDKPHLAQLLDREMDARGPARGRNVGPYGPGSNTRPGGAELGGRLPVRAQPPDRPTGGPSGQSRGIPAPDPRQEEPPNATHSDAVHNAVNGLVEIGLLQPSDFGDELTGPLLRLREPQALKAIAECREKYESLGRPPLGVSPTQYFLRFISKYSTR